MSRSKILGSRGARRSRLDGRATAAAAPPPPTIVPIGQAGPGYRASRDILSNISAARPHGGVAGAAYSKFKATLSSDANLRSAAEAERSSIMVTHLRAPAPNGKTLRRSPRCGCTPKKTLHSLAEP